MELLRKFAHNRTAIKWGIVSFCIFSFLFLIVGLVMPKLFTKFLKYVRQQFHFIHFSNVLKKSKLCENGFFVPFVITAIEFDAKI